MFMFYLNRQFYNIYIVKTPSKTHSSLLNVIVSGPVFGEMDEMTVRYYNVKKWQTIIYYHDDDFFFLPVRRTDDSICITRVPAAFVVAAARPLSVRFNRADVNFLFSSGLALKIVNRRHVRIVVGKIKCFISHNTAESTILITYTFRSRLYGFYFVRLSRARSDVDGAYILHARVAKKKKNG